MPRFGGRRFRFQTQLLILLFLFGAVPMVATVSFGYSVSRQTIIDQAREALRELGGRQASYLTTEIRREQLILRTIAGQIGPAVTRGTGDTRTLLAGSLADDGVFDGLRLLDNRRTVVADVAFRETAPYWPDHSVSGVQTSGMTLHLEGDSVVAYLLTVPVEGTVDPWWLQGHVRAADFGKNFDIPLHLLGGVELGVFDDERNVVIVPHQHATGALRGNLPASAARPDEVIDATLGSEPALVFGTPLAEMNWYMVAALPLSVVLERVDRVLALTALGGVLLALLIVGAGLAASRVVTTPLRELSAAAASFGATGEYETVMHPGVAETEALIASFQSMAATLRRSGEEIERLHAREMERAQQLATVGELASGVAHEIRNPLTGVLGALEVVGKRLSPGDRARPMLEEAEAQLRRIESTTSQLLEYARPPELRKVDIEIWDVIDRAVRVVKSIADKSGIIIQVEVVGSPRAVQADPELLVQVLINLLLNAIDASSPSGTVRIEALEVRHGTELRVIDQGGGISPDLRHEIFRPFFTTKHQGTGLGLSISHQIVTRHGGSLRVEETPGGGATFVLLLPTPS